MVTEPGGRIERLRSLIATRVRAGGGWLAFEDYMQLALHEPGLGYYAGGPAQLGREGDFVTAPELGSLFARCLARFAAAALPLDGSILEIGGGSGRLLRDVASELDRMGTSAREYLVLETSALLAEQQDDTLAQTPNVRRIRSLPQQFRGVIIANEVLDALPCRALALREDGWRKRGIRFAADGTLAWADGPMADPADAQRLAVFDLPLGYQTEIGRQAEALAGSLARCLECGAILLIDYGFAAAEYYHAQRSQGTLMAHRRHRASANVLERPGETDITAHIDFSAVCAAAAAEGASLAGFAAQGSFLIDCGIADFFAAEANPSDWRSMQQQSSEAQMLLMPHEMGELFKALALAKGTDVSLPGFGSQDLSGRL